MNAQELDDLLVDLYVSARKKPLEDWVAGAREALSRAAKPDAYTSGDQAPESETHGRDRKPYFDPFKPRFGNELDAKR